MAQRLGFASFAKAARRRRGFGQLSDQIDVAQTSLEARQPLRGLIRVESFFISARHLTSKTEKGSFSCRRRFI